MSFLKDPLHQPTVAHEVDLELADFRRSDPNERHHPQLAGRGESGDAELGDIVRRFEQLYAELTPTPEPQVQLERDDELIIELPDDLGARESRWTHVTEGQSSPTRHYAPA